MSRVAWVIGINRYLSLPKKADGISGDLERAAGDAEAIASCLDRTYASTLYIAYPK
jgi:hypothetical protein